MMSKILKRSLSTRSLLMYAFSAVLAPVLIQNASIAQPARAWGPGETPAQAAERVVTDEQIVNVNGVDKEVKKGEVINSEEGAISVNGLSVNAISVEKGKEAVLQNGTRFLKDGTMVLSDGTAITADGITILPDGREEVKESQKADKVLAGVVANQGQTQGAKSVVGEGNFIAGLSCGVSAPNEVLISASLISPVTGILYVDRNLVFGFDRGKAIPVQGVTPPQREAFNEVLRVPERKGAVNVTGAVYGLRNVRGSETAYEFKIQPNALTVTCD